MLGLVLVISSMVLSCSDKDEPVEEPDAGEPPMFRFLLYRLLSDGWKTKWMVVNGGVGIKVTSKTTNNLVFECTPGDKVQSYRLMFILYVVCITTSI